mgnify:CR=1 FL=1
MSRLKLATDADGDCLEHFRFFNKEELKIIRTYEITPEQRVVLFRQARKGDAMAIATLKDKLHVTIRRANE